MIGTTLNGRFRLERELGRGGMGAVYRAIDLVLDRPVAIKVLTKLTGEELSRRIRLEAQILARLVHEHVVRLYDFSADGDQFYFVMEEVDGPSFAKRIRHMNLLDRIQVVIQTARALDYAHRQGVIHRDVKPANILLTSTDQARLSDFGLSLLNDASQESGVVRGTPHYMSPEQARGRKIDHRTDLYALGVILYECATGTLPFSGPVMSVMSQHIHADVESPRVRNPAITDDLAAVVVSLMAKDRLDRPASGQDVADRLLGLIASGRVLVEQASRSASTLPIVASSAPNWSKTGSDAGPISPPIPTGAGSLAPSSASRPVAVSAVATPASSPRTDPLVAQLIAAVTQEPIELDPEERFLYGHYLAYLLGGSRRRGLLLRRPLDQLNGDRARLLLAMAALTLPDGDAVEIEAAARLLESRAEVRTSLSPVVVAKYLAARSTLPRRKQFRKIRQQLQQASEYAARHLTDDQGVLNPGLMPQVIDDLKRLAPVRTELDDQLVDRWNQVSEIWRAKPKFRVAVLRYATKAAWQDPASDGLWPEVVYPLIERARRQRQLRSNAELVWDTICGSLLHVGDAGVKMDRAIRTEIPQRIVREIELSLHNIIDDEAIEAEPEPEATPVDDSARITSGEISARSFHDVEIDAPTRSLIKLTQPNPFRQTVGELHELWKDAVAILRSGGNASLNGQKALSLGPYRLVVIGSVRSRSAGQVAIQGMPNKQIELLVPPFMSGGPSSKVLVAAWVYRNNSLAITYYDNLNTPRYVVWDASVNQQTNLDDLAALNSHLYCTGMELPEQADVALTSAFRPIAS